MSGPYYHDPLENHVRPAGSSLPIPPPRGGAAPAAPGGHPGFQSFHYGGPGPDTQRLAPLPPSDLAIDTGASSDPVVRFAAEQLQLYASRMEGKRPVIDGEGQRRIFLGKLPSHLPDAEAKELENRCAKLGPDGFLLRSRPEGLLILGGGTRGVLYGTYALLERCGMRFFFPGDERVGPRNKESAR